MRARKLAYRLMMVLPLLYIGTITARARLHVDSYSFPACTPKQQEAILAYREPFVEASSFRGSTIRSIDAGKLRSVCDDWIRQSKEGKLVALTPVNLHDFVRDGIKQQIFRSSNQMARLLTESARQSSGSGEWSTAAEDLVRSLQLVETLKYSDPHSLSQTGIFQRATLAQLLKVVDRLDPIRRLWVLSALKELRNGQQSLEPMVRLTYRLYKNEEHKATSTRSLASVESLLADAGKADERSVAVLASLPTPIRNESDNDPDFVALLRMCGLSQAHLISQLDTAIEMLGTTSVVENPKGARIALVSP